jgi:hypothetical protein
MACQHLSAAQRNSRLYALPLVGVSPLSVLWHPPFSMPSRGRPWLYAGRPGFEVLLLSSAHEPSALGLRITSPSRGRRPESRAPPLM